MKWLPIQATNKHVAKTGLDTNRGTIRSPYRTIKKGIENILPGDTLFVKEGTYTEYVRLRNSGTIGHPIVLKNYVTDIVTIDAENSRVFCIYSKDQNYLVVDGINVKNATHYNILLEGCENIILKNISSTVPITSFPVCQNFKIIGSATKWGENITLQNIKATGGYFGIWITGRVKNSVINNSEVSYAARAGVNINLDNVSDPNQIQLENCPHNIVVDGVYSHHNGSSGIGTRIASNITIRNTHCAYNGSTGIQIEAYTDSSLIENNICEYGSRVFNYEAGIWIFNSTNSIVRRNILQNNQTGLRISKMKNFAVYNNLIINNNFLFEGVSENTSGVDFSESTGSFFNNTLFGNCASNSKLGSIHVFPLSIEFGIIKPSNITIKNNIVMNDGSAKDMDFDQSVRSTVTSDYNLFYNQNRDINIQVGTTNHEWNVYKILSKQEAHSINADPQFIDAENRNFNLRSTSPAINSGTSVKFNNDINANSINSFPNIGAF